MPVLRSRDIPPPPNPKSSSPETLEFGGFIQPTTPSKFTEFLAIPMNSSPNSPQFDLNLAPMSSPPRRRSTRLNLDSEENSGSLSPDSGTKLRRNQGGGDGIDGSGWVSVDKGSIRASGCEEGVEGGGKKVRGEDSDALVGVELEQVSGYLNLRSGTKVVKKSEEREKGRGKGKGKEKVVLIEDDDGFLIGREIEVEEGLGFSRKDENLKSSPRKRLSREEKGKGVVISRRLSREEKGKGVMSYMGDDDCDLNELDVGFGNDVELDGEVGGWMDKMDSGVHENLPTWRTTRQTRSGTELVIDFARRVASRYADSDDDQEGFHVGDGEDEAGMLQEHLAEDFEAWPGPFSTAIENLSDRENNSNYQRQNFSFVGGSVNNTDADIHRNILLEIEERNKKRRKVQFKDIAKRLASEYAHFDGQERGENCVDDEDEDDDEEECSTEPQLELPAGNVEDWPGPFSTAIKIIRDREKNSKNQVRNFSSVVGSFPLVSWTPRKEGDPTHGERAVPSLQSLCLNILAENVDAITSLEFVPDGLRNKLSRLLCDSRQMNPHFLRLLLDGSPAEIRLVDGSWLEERVFETSFESCNFKTLTVLQLDLCGHCLTDYSLQKALLRKGLEALTTISLKGACRVSDVGLAALVSSAPALRSMNLSQCSLLTDVGIDSIANSLGSILEELYLDDCDTLNAMKILPILKRLEKLEVLSLRGISSVSDKFIRKLFRKFGQNMKELILADCVNLTDISLKVISGTCSQLCVLDLRNLRKLTDIGMAHITNGCCSIVDLKLCRSPFSDDAIAALLETSGESLKELSLNYISKVGQNTVISLARRCKNLESLDLSWCRCLTNEALGYIADSCLSLKLLKIFGCTQVTNIFVNGHSNPDLHIVGLQMTPILEHIKRPDWEQ